MPMLATLTKSAHSPNIDILDKKLLSILKQALLKHKIKYQLVPPHIHRRNAAERDIKTIKAHLISCLCDADTQYPSKDWDLFILQAKITLNLIRGCLLNPKLSAYTTIHVVFDY